jgi:Fur family ferric uptake transcriptional regulator
MSNLGRYQTAIAGPEDVPSLLRERGLRVTAQRRVVCEVLLAGRDEHLSADQVLERSRQALPEISRATVYNAIADLAAVGLVRPVAGAGAQRYDVGSEPHGHFRCRACGALHDIEPATDEVVLPDAGFVLELVHLVAEGLCPACARGQASA